MNRTIGLMAFIGLVLCVFYAIHKYVMRVTTCPSCGDQLENNKWQNNRLECPSCDFIQFY